MKPLAERLDFMARIAKKGGLPNLAAALADAATEVRRMEWEITVLKQGRMRRKMERSS